MEQSYPFIDTDHGCRLLGLGTRKPWLQVMYRDEEPENHGSKLCIGMKSQKTMAPSYV